MTQLAGQQVAELAYAAGFRNTGGSEDLTTAVALAAVMSGWRPNAHAVTSDEDSRGLWGINVYAYPQYRDVNLYNPKVSAVVAYSVYTGAGRSFNPWSAYLYGRHQQYAAAARAAVRAIAQSGGYLPPLSASGEAPWTGTRYIRDSALQLDGTTARLKYRTSQVSTMRGAK